MSSPVGALHSRLLAPDRLDSSPRPAIHFLPLYLANCRIKTAGSLPKLFLDELQSSKTAIQRWQLCEKQFEMGMKLHERRSCPSNANDDRIIYRRR